MKPKLLLYLTLVLSALAVSARPEFIYVTNSDNTITITGCTDSGSVIVPSTINGLRVTSIGNFAFGRHPTITSVSIPDSVTNIGDGAFTAVDTGSGLTNIVIGNGVKSIGHNAFQFCEKLTVIKIPSQVTSIGIMAFGGCFGLKEIIVDTNNAAFITSDGVLFNKNRTALIQFPPGKAGDCVIPEGVTNIAHLALWNCPHLTSVTIPEGITSIGDEEFAACSSLTTVIIPASVTNIGQNAFNSCVSMKSIYFRGNAPDYGEYWRGGRAKILGGLDTGTVYYLAGTMGWGTNFGGRPTALWNSQIMKP